MTHIINSYTAEGKYIYDPSLINIYGNDKKVFRKMMPSQKEIQLCNFIKNNPHKNIVTFYHIGQEYIDMELLNLVEHPI